MLMAAMCMTIILQMKLQHAEDAPNQLFNHDLKSWVVDCIENALKALRGEYRRSAARCVRSKWQFLVELLQRVFDGSKYFCVVAREERSKAAAEG
jgi:hypothetical protein